MPSDSPSSHSASLRELANALTALGSYLAAAKNGTLRSESGSKLDQVLGKTVAQHERAVRVVRELRDEFLRNAPR
jgi:hypothetical protein